MVKDQAETIIGASDIDALLEESKIFIPRQAIEAEIEYRLRKEIGSIRGLLVVLHPDGEAPGSKVPALTVLGIEHALGISKDQGMTRIQVRNTHPLIPGCYLVCSNEMLPQLRSEVKQFLAHEHVDQVYNLDLDHLAKLELRCRMEEVSRNVNRLMADAWSVNIRVSDSNIEYWMPDPVTSGVRLSARITETILPRLNYGWEAGQR